MVILQRSIRLLVLQSLLLCGILPAQSGLGPFAYLPSEEVADPRMLSVGCLNNDTQDVELGVLVDVPPGEGSFTLSLFDGEVSNGLAGEGYWDSGTRQVVYRLFRDPMKSGNIAPGDLIFELFSRLLCGSNPWVWSISTMAEAAEER